MRVMMLTPGGVDASGRERVIPALLSLIERLARRHDVTVVALRQYDRPRRYPLLGARVVNLGAWPGLPAWRRFGRYLAGLRAVAREHGRPDVVHAFWAGDAGLLGGLAGRAWRAPVVVSVGSGEFTWLPAIGYGMRGRRVDRARVALALRLANAVTGGSRFVLRGLEGREARWLPLGADAGVFRPASALSAGPPWRIVQVANLNPVKDQGTLLRALRRVRQAGVDARLDHVGVDTLGGRVQALAGELGLADAVAFHGFLAQEALAPLVARAHLFAQSSLFESQGVAVAEAALAGVPTAGTAVGLVAELAPEAAVAVPVGDAEALAGAIVGLLQDGAQRARLGRAARAWSLAHDADWTWREFEAVYGEVVG